MIDDVTKLDPLIQNGCMRFYEFHGGVIKEWNDHKGMERNGMK